MSDSDSFSGGDMLGMAINEFSRRRDDFAPRRDSGSKIGKTRIAEEEDRDMDGKYIKKKPKKKTPKKPNKKKRKKSDDDDDEIFNRSASDEDGISIRVDGIGSGEESETSRAAKKVLFRPAMLPEEQTEHLHEADEDLRELQDQGGSNECKLCDLGDNGVTKITGEALKEIFALEQTLFRKVPDSVIWKLQEKLWFKNIVEPNRHLGISVPSLTIGEIRRHYKQYHDISNPRRLLWDQIFFLLRSMNYFRKNGGIWETKIVNNIEQAELEFNNDKFKEWSNMAKHCSNLIVLSEKIEGRDKAVPSTSKTASGRGSSKHGSSNKNGSTFTHY